MTTAQTKSKQRITDHGEVYTHEREVNAMLDLVADQAANPEKTFLEPACGNGNFLAEILRRKLATVAVKYQKVQLDYERYGILSISSLYGIELLPDNVEECRTRLFVIFKTHYQTAYPQTWREECLRAAHYILSQNIVCGDALSLRTRTGTKIILPEWKLIGSNLQRRDYTYQDLIDRSSDRELPFFSDKGEAVYIPKPAKEYPLTYFTEVGDA